MKCENCGKEDYCRRCPGCEKFLCSDCAGWTIMKGGEEICHVCASLEMSLEGKEIIYCTAAEPIIYADEFVKNNIHFEIRRHRGLLVFILRKKE